MVDYLRHEWSAHLGIEVSFEPSDSLSWYRGLNKESGHAIIAGWHADYPDPANFLRDGIMNGGFSSSWYNETYDRLVRQALQTRDQSERMHLYHQADQILVQEAAIIPLVYERVHRLSKPWLTFPRRDKDANAKDIIIHPH